MATEIAGLVLTAKHLDRHYLVPIYCSLGGTLCLSWRWLRARWPAHAAAVAAVSLSAIVLVRALAFQHEVQRLTSARAVQETAAQTASTLIARDQCLAIWAYRASSEAEALQWGNISAQFNRRPILGREIAQRFPRALFDMGRLEIRDADWQPVDFGDLLRREPCVIYSGETARAPAGATGVRVERLGTSGFESIYRLRPPE